MKRPHFLRSDAPLATAPRAARVVPVLAAFVLWAGAGAGAVWWGLLGAAQPTAVVSPLAAQPAADAAAVARALGHSAPVKAAEPSTAQRFKVLGVIASTSPRTPSGRANAQTNTQTNVFGSVLIAADGQPAQALVVGQQVADGWHVHRVSASAVQLRQAQSLATVDLPVPSTP